MRRLYHDEALRAKSRERDRSRSASASIRPWRPVRSRRRFRTSLAGRSWLRSCTGSREHGLALWLGHAPASDHALEPPRAEQIGRV